MWLTGQLDLGGIAIDELTKNHLIYLLLDAALTLTGSQVYSLIRNPQHVL